MIKRHVKIKISAIGLLLPFLVLWLGSCAVNPVSGQRELMLLSEADEIKLGNQTDAQVVQGYGIYDDQKLNAYGNDLCQRLAKLSHRSNLSYQFKILDSPVVNAFAVPGGYIYFTRGIMAYLNSEAELAGVMGHELGHITARHSAQQYSKAQITQLGLGLGMVLSETLRTYSDLAQFGAQMLFLKFSRDDERQADDLGVEYSTKAGYDAAEMADFFGTLDRMHPSSEASIPSWFSTHPNPVDRHATVQRNAKEWQQKMGLTNLKIDRNEYLRRIDGLVFGEDPRQGYVENNVFYHPALRFRFPVPADWKLQNTRTAVQMVSSKKDAVILFSIASQGSPEEAAQAFVRESKASVIQSNPDKVSGFSTHRLITQIQTQQGLLRVMSYFIQKDAKVYVFHGFSSINLFSAYSPIFKNTMSGFNDLKDPGKINVKPERIRIRTTPKGGSLRQVLLDLGAHKDKLEQLAILNGKHLNDRIAANTLLKLVEK